MGGKSMAPMGMMPKTGGQSNRTQGAPTLNALLRAGDTAAGGAQGDRRASLHQREILTNAMVYGVVAQVSGSTGWITPTEVIRHPMNRGRIYVHTLDVEEGVELEEGLAVVFWLYVDPQGLGAMRVKHSTEEEVEAEIELLIEKYGLEEEKVPLQKPGAIPAMYKSGHQDLLGDEPAAKRLRTGALVTDLSDAQEEAVMLKAESVEAAKACAKFWKGEMQRERISESEVTGEVVVWYGTHGWISLHEDLLHPKALERNGKVYMSKEDLDDGGTVRGGDMVQFHVFLDDSGLGAESISRF